MMKNQLLKKISLGIASVALVAPLLLASASAHPTNASTARQTQVMPDESRSSFLKGSSGSQHQSNLLKHASIIFVQKGNKVYTAKANGTNMFPSTMKYYSSLSYFKKRATTEINRLKHNKRAYHKNHNHSYLKHMAHETRFSRIAQLPSSYKVPSVKSHNTFQFKDYSGKVETLLKSKFKRGNNHKAKKSGFAYGPRENNAFTVFNKYKPNDSRAIVPKHFKVRPDQTVWLVGHHTNSLHKIDRFHDAYYYNGQAKGWADIGL